LLALVIPAGTEAGPITVVNVIPKADSGETDQNSETSIAVLPTNPQQIAISAFANGATNPYYASANGGLTWTRFDNVAHGDTSLSWSPSGTLYMARLYNVVLSGGGVPIQGSIDNQKVTNPAGGGTFSQIANSVYTTPTNTSIPDQPSIKVAQVGGQDRLYTGFNNLSNAGGKSASVRVSTDGGSTYQNVTIESVTPGAGQDAPSVRVAVNGNTVYAAFVRWTSMRGDSSANNGLRFNSQIVVVRDDNGATGATKFQALGAAGSTVASPITIFTQNSPAAGSLGNERVSADLAIAVDPKNASHVYLAATESPTPGALLVHVYESTDGGVTWVSKFLTSASIKAALPSIAVADNGTVGLLYESLETLGGASYLETRFLQTADDFATTNESILARFVDGTPAPSFDPYVGDFFNLDAVGNQFFGTFGASNLDDGVNAIFPQGLIFQRDFTGTPGTSSFQLTDNSGAPVAASIDPYFFTLDVTRPAAPEPSSLALLALGGAALAGWRRWRKRRVA
jgi:hypothetical protein